MRSSTGLRDYLNFLSILHFVQTSEADWKVLPSDKSKSLFLKILNQQRIFLSAQSVPS